MQGYERREVVKDANETSNIKDASVPLAPVMRPVPSSFSKVGNDMRALSKIMDTIGDKYEAYKEKKKAEDIVQGQLLRTQGVTEEDLLKSGNKHNMTGWQVMNVKLAQDEHLQNELAFIQGVGKEMSTDEYRQHLQDRNKELYGSLPANSQMARDMVTAGSLDLFPKLVQEHVKQHNEYNRIQTLDTSRKAVVGSIMQGNVEEASDLYLGVKESLSKEDNAELLTTILQDQFALGSSKGEEFVSTLSKGKPIITRDAEESLLSLIRKTESNGDYNIVYGENTSSRDLSNMTLNEVKELQQDLIAQQRAAGVPEDSISSAIGAYQIISKTLEETADKLGLTGDELFNKELQDELGAALLKSTQALQYAQNGDYLMAQEALSKKWASFPKDSSGQSYYAGVGKNKALVEPDVVLDALYNANSKMQLHGALSDLGLSGSQINRVIDSRKQYEVKNSTNLSVKKKAIEQDIINNKAGLPDEELIPYIKEQARLNAYSESWENSMYNSVQRVKDDKVKEQAKLYQLYNMIDTNTIKNGTKQEQEQAIDIVTQRALENNIEGLDPNDPAYPDAIANAEKEVFTFMYENNIKDSRMANRLDQGLSGVIVDKDGKLTPSAAQAYSAYTNMLDATNDPLYVKSMLSDNVYDVVALADRYRSSYKKLNANDALISASAFLDTQRTSKVQYPIPWWSKHKTLEYVEKELRDKINPSIISNVALLVNANSMEAISGIKISNASVEQAVNSPEVLNRIKQVAADEYHLRKNWQDQDLAREMALEKAAVKVVNNSEYVLGSLVYTDGKSLSESLGMDKNNSAHAVMAKIMSDLGPVRYGDDWNNTDVFTMSPRWEVTEPGFKKTISGVAQAAVQSINVPKTVSRLARRASDNWIRGVPDFAVNFDSVSGTFVLMPYLNYDRTDTGDPMILTIKQLKTAAQLLKMKNTEGYNKWIEHQKTMLKPLQPQE